jgi:hypothetical protein
MKLLFWSPVHILVGFFSDLKLGFVTEVYMEIFTGFRCNVMTSRRSATKHVYKAISKHISYL